MPRRYSMSCRSSRIRAGEHACTVHLVEAEGHAVLARCADKRWAFLMKSRDRRAGQGEARWLLQLCRLKLCQLAIASARAQTSATTDSCRQPTASRPSRGRGARSRVVGDGVALYRPERGGGTNRRIALPRARWPSGYCGCGCRARRGCPSSDSQRFACSTIRSTCH